MKTKETRLILGLCDKIMSFRDLSKLLTITPNFQEAIPNISKHFLCLFIAKLSISLHVNKVAMKISRPFCAFCCTHDHIPFQNSMIVHYLIPI